MDVVFIQQFRLLKECYGDANQIPVESALVLRLICKDSVVALGE